MVKCLEKFFYYVFLIMKLELYYDHNIIAFCTVFIYKVFKYFKYE